MAEGGRARAEGKRPAGAHPGRWRGGGGDGRRQGWLDTAPEPLDHPSCPFEKYVSSFTKVGNVTWSRKLKLRTWISRERYLNRSYFGAYQFFSNVVFTPS